MTEYRRYHGKSYMVWSGEAAIEGYEYPMLLENQIKGLLSLHISNADEKTQFWYDISGKYALEDWVKIKKPGCDFLKKFMTKLAEALEQAGEYLLDEDGISLMPERIFVDAEEKEITFCHMPFEKSSFLEALRSFMEYYLSHMEHGNGENTQKCYLVYEMCQRENVTLEELIALLFEGEEDIEQVNLENTFDQIESISANENDVKEIPVKPMAKKKQKFIEQAWSKKIFPVKKKKKQKMEEMAYAFEPEEYQTESTNPTIFLGSETEQILGELRYEGDGNEKNLEILAPVFLIGTQKDEVQGVIHNETISRIHAKISVEEDCYYIEDMNSTNGTYRNGELLNYREKVRLEKNDRIMFAKESYRFV